MKLFFTKPLCLSTNLSFNKKNKIKKSFLSLGLLCATSSYSYALGTNPPNPVNPVDTGSSFKVLDEQRYTGSLLSPSGAVTKAGLLALEPYFQSTISRGAYLSDGRVRSNKNRTDSADSFLLIKYGITNRLTFQTAPQVNYYWNGHTTSSTVHFSDLPIDFQYRFIDQVDRHYKPSLSGFLGFGLPTGDYNNLKRGLDAAGTGSYTLRFGLQSQAAYKVFSKALRVRVWNVARKPLNSVDIKGISSYGTDVGYRGNAKSGLFGNWGFSLEYGLTKEWVMAFDFQYDWAKGTRMRGAYPNEGFKRYVSAASHDIQVAPAIEYNPTDVVGIIAGTSLTVDGHNTNDFIQPQIAVNIIF